MKKYTALALLLILGSITTNVSAGDENSTYEKPAAMEDRAVIAHDFDLDLEVTDGKLAASWDAFDVDGFEWFKLVYSTTNSAPVYPHDKTVFIGKVDQLETTFKLQSGASKHYVRLCAVVLNDDYSKDRYCGDTQIIEATVSANDSQKNYEKKDTVKKEYTAKDDEKKEAIKKAVAKKTVAKKATLSKNVQTRIDTVLSNFIQRLEDKDYSDEKMVETIDIVLGRLEKLKDNVKYEKIIAYMETTLNKYRADYDSGLGELESIFSDF